MTERCAGCGKFVPYAQMEQGGGARFHFEPLNEFGPEVSEWTCKQCNQQDHREAGGANNAPASNHGN